MLPMDEIYKSHSRTVFRYLLSLTHDSDLSEELTQETFYQAVKCAGRFDGSCKVTTWLCAIAKNQLLVFHRKHPPTDSLDEQTAAADMLETEILGDISKVSILKKLHRLDDPFREVMYLRLFGDLPFREIGDVFGKTENWARVTYYRGKEKLKKEMDQDG